MRNTRFLLNLTVRGFDLELTGVTEARPRLAIQNTPTNAVVISWPYPSSGFDLMETSSFNGTNWTEVTTLPTQVGDDYQVPVANPSDARFYRLRKD